MPPSLLPASNSNTINTTIFTTAFFTTMTTAITATESYTVDSNGYYRIECVSSFQTERSQTLWIVVLRLRFVSGNGRYKNNTETQVGGKNREDL